MNVVLGFVFILLLGFLGSRLALFQGAWRRRIPFLTLAGIEFIFVGVLFGPHVTNVLTEPALQKLSPVLSLGLGWIGLLIGMQYEWKIVRRISSSAWLTALFVSGITFFAVFAALWYVVEPLLKTFATLYPGDSYLERDSLYGFIQSIRRTGLCLALGATAIVSTHTALALIKKDAAARGENIRLLQLLTDLRSPMAILVMGAWYSLFHVSSWGVFPDAVNSSLLVMDAQAARPVVGFPSAPYSYDQLHYIMSGGSWLAVAIMLGVTLGWMLHYLTSERLPPNAMLVVLTGSVVLSSGLAASLHLSPLFVNWIMGVTLTNLPNFARGRVSNLFVQMEKPFFVVFMILVGAMWPPITLGIVLLAALYCLARMLGLTLSMALGHRMIWRGQNPHFYRLGLAMLPQGGLAIALMLDYRLILPGVHSEAALSVVILAVLINQLIGPGLLAMVLRKTGEIAAVETVESWDANLVNEEREN